MTIAAIKVIQRPIEGLPGAVRITNCCPICGHVVRSNAWFARHVRIKHGGTS